MRSQNGDFVSKLMEEKRRIALTEEMGRRVGMSEYESHRFLAAENLAAREANRPVDMGNVAWAIHNAVKETP